MNIRTSSDEGPALAGPSSLSVRFGLGSRAATTAALTALTAATAGVLAETLRVLFPLLYHFAEEIGFLTAAGVIPLIFLAPFAVSLVSAALGMRGALAVTAGAVFAARSAMQAGSPTLAVAATGSMAGFGALAMLVEAFRRHESAPAEGALESRFGGLAFVGGVLAGLLADTAVRLAHITWDPAWQSGLWSWVPCLTLAGLGAMLLVAVVLGVGAGDPDTRTGGRAFAVAALGPFFALELLVLASPAFAASSGRLSPPVAGLVVLLGWVAGFGVLAAPCRRGPLAAMTVAAGGVLAAIVGALTGAYAVSGIWAAAALVLGQALAVWLLALTFQIVTHRPASGRGSGGWRGGIGAGMASVLFVAVLLPYQIHYELPLPFSNRVLPAIAALVLGLLAVRSVRLTGSKRSLRYALAGCGGALIAGFVPLALALTAPAAGGPPEGAGGEDGSFRLVSYNIHEAVNVNGHLNPESIAAVIESQDADVVALQEVGRGWPLSATMDVGAWLARRLDMRLVYGPAADQQFGNAILTELPVGDVARGRLPQGSGSMVRGYVMAEISVGDERVEVWSTHLQHHDDTTATRIAEIDELLGVWDGAAPAVLTGDMNARPGSAEMRVWFSRTDLRSAQDVTGHSALPTCCWPDVDHRIDWILGTPDVRFSGFSIPRTTASDHLPQAVTVTVSK